MITTQFCIHQFIESQVSRTPLARALVFEGRSLTYQELNARANQLARYLCSQGIGPHTLVGLLVRPSFEMIIGILGILKAGGAYVPLDPAHPKERLEFLIQDARLNIILTNLPLPGVLEGLDVKSVFMDQLWSFILELEDTDLECWLLLSLFWISNEKTV